MNISVVIPNFNGKMLLEKQLPLVEKARENSKNHINEVIVIDDASSDDSVLFIRNNFPKVKIIRHRINRGFSSSVNIGVRSAKGELVVLINNDVYPEIDFVEKSLRHFDDDRVLGVS